MKWCLRPCWKTWNGCCKPSLGRDDLAFMYILVKTVQEQAYVIWASTFCTCMCALDNSNCQILDVVEHPRRAGTWIGTHVLFLCKYVGWAHVFTVSLNFFRILGEQIKLLSFWSFGGTKIHIRYRALHCIISVTEHPTSIVFDLFAF